MIAGTKTILSRATSKPKPKPKAPKVKVDCSHNKCAWGAYGKWVVIGIVVAFVCIALLMALHSHYQLKRQRRPIRGTVWMGKGVQGVVRRATTFKGAVGRGGRRPPGPPPGWTADVGGEKGLQEEGVVANGTGTGERQPAAVGHCGKPPPGPPPGVNGEKVVNNEAAAFEGYGQQPIGIGHSGQPPPGPPPMQDSRVTPVKG